MTQGQQRHNIAGKIKTSKQVCSRCCPIRTTAPAHNTPGAGVYIKPLPNGEVAILRETPQQRLQRLQRLQRVYALQGAEVFNEVARKEAERLERKTEVVFILASARIRAHLRRKRLLEKSGLSLSYTGNLGVHKQKVNNCERFDSSISASGFVSRVFERAPPSGEALKLCQALSFTPSDVWLGFACPRAVRAPTRHAARAGAAAR